MCSISKLHSSYVLSPSMLICRYLVDIRLSIQYTTVAITPQLQDNDFSPFTFSSKLGPEVRLLGKCHMKRLFDQGVLLLPQKIRFLPEVIPNYEEGHKEKCFSVPHLVIRRPREWEQQSATQPVVYHISHHTGEAW